MTVLMTLRGSRWFYLQVGGGGRRKGGGFAKEKNSVDILWFGSDISDHIKIKTLVFKLYSAYSSHDEDK